MSRIAVALGVVLGLQDRLANAVSGVLRSRDPPPGTQANPSELLPKLRRLWQLRDSDLGDNAGGVSPPMSREDFAKLAPAPEDWCPWCTDPELCRKPFLFVVATGRSGSTTMQNMVNFLPGISVWGENYMLTNFLMKMEGTMQPWHQAQGAGMVGQSRAMSHPPANHTRFSLDSQQLMWDLLEPPPQRMIDNTVRGFKERRWNRDNIAWVAKDFPCSRFIVNFRNDLEAQADDAIEVGWRRKSGNSKENQMRKLARRTQDIRIGVAGLGERGFSFALEDYNVENFNRLARWLGSPCRYNRVVHLNFNGTLRAPEAPCDDCITCPRPGEELPGVADEIDHHGTASVRSVDEESEGHNEDEENMEEEEEGDDEGEVDEDAAELAEIEEDALDSDGDDGGDNDHDNNNDDDDEEAQENDDENEGDDAGDDDDDEDSAADEDQDDEGF